ncbi:MAG: ImmA/IrrE family metallo-endopeptidase [Solirubrobacteraceae bacterium]
MKQLQAFANATHTPVGYMFLPKPPEERLPVPDFRTVANAAVGRASPDLLDTVYQCQQRQEWYRGYAQLHGEPSVSFVATLARSDGRIKAARKMRDVLGFDPVDRGRSWSEALRRLTASAEDNGVLVMISGVVGSNTHRKLDPQEFRGFALCDDLAPLIFVNGADTKAAQIFTFVHELVHLWLGQSAVSDVDMKRTSTNATERWCNQVAAEFLVPAELLTDAGLDIEHLTEGLDRLARQFKVSTLVVLRCVFDAGMLTDDQYRHAYEDELKRVKELIEERTSTGGDFYKTQPARVGKRFARALIQSTLEGQTLHRDAFQMLGFKKHATFLELAHRLGVEH